MDRVLTYIGYWDFPEEAWWASLVHQTQQRDRASETCSRGSGGTGVPGVVVVMGNGGDGVMGTG